MSKSRRSEESRLDKFKNFFGFGGVQGNIQVDNLRPPQRQFILTAEQIKEIGPGSPHNNRISTIKEFCDIVLNRRLEENAVEVLWLNVKDLLDEKVPTENRQLALYFFTCLVKGQYDQLGIMRAHFFRVVRDHKVPEDLPNRFELFAVLSADGKDLKQFEEETGELMLSWMKDVINTSYMHSFMRLLINIIKYNAAYLDEEVVAGLIMNTCVVGTRSEDRNNVELCLDLLDKILCYYYLPASSLPQFIDCMCRATEEQKYCQTAWLLMRKLLGTHLGHSGIYTMCCILQDKNNNDKHGDYLLRGAVFFIGMALWGSKRVTSLKHPPSTVLPSFLQALEISGSSMVAIEVALSLHRLVAKYGREQQIITWDLILSIVENLLNTLGKIDYTQDHLGAELASKVHDLLSAVEELHKQKQFNGNTDKLFRITESCASKRPETSILALISHKSESIHPSQATWLTSLNHLMDKYFVHEIRTQIREKVLEILSSTLNNNKYLYEDELIDGVVLTQLCHIENDSDLEVRKRAAQVLLDLVSSCRSHRCMDLIELLHKIIKRMFSTGSASTSPVPQAQAHHIGKSHDQRLDDIYVSVAGLVTIFKSKLFQLPCNHAQRIFEILVDHLEMHYNNEFMMKTAPHIRKSILEVLLDLRADSLFRLGLTDKRRSNYSPYILCTYRAELCDDTSKSPTDSPQMACGSPVEGSTRITIISYKQAFRAVRTCLEKEMDWQVLQLVLEKLPQVLQNKTLILSADPDDLAGFTLRLCAMVNNSNLRLPDKLWNKPDLMSKSEFHSRVFPVLTCLVSYHTHLDKQRQIELVRCLEFGLVSRSARECVRALTVCSLEMSDVMIKQLPNVLLRLSQICATVTMAIPLMEFLSGLIRLPLLYANFIEDQYLSFFAIALPYTNPFKYSHYTVSLAYHVIAMWFLKCKLSFRKKFVKFIIKGLHANVLRPFDETLRARENGDSSDRGRVRSLNDEATMRVKAQAAVATKRKEQQKPDEKKMQFHRELMETCIDMMSRFAFSTCASLPKRSNVAEFLLEGGHMQSWLLGTKIVSITTSGGARVGPTGLCDKCLQFARRASEKMQNPTPAEPASSARKRHRTEAVKSRSETVVIKPTSQDDILLHQRAAALREEQSQSDTALPTQSSNSTLGSISSTPRSLEDSTASPDPSLGASSKEHKLQLVDNVLMSLTAKPTDKSVFSPQQVHCNCWCTLWAEIHIRRPTGNLSWMLRLQNEQNLSEAFPEIMADISNLFMTSPEDDILQYRERKKIDSMTLGESEYDTLLEEHFMSDDSSFDVEEDEHDGVLTELEAGLRKSSSSPDLTAIQQEQLMRGRAQSDLQQVYTRSLEIQKIQSTSKPVFKIQSTSKPVFQRQISAPPSPQKSDGERSTSESSNPGDEVDARLSSISVRGHAKLSRKISAPPAMRPVSLDATGIEFMTAGWSAAANVKEAQANGGVSPCFLFLQLYHSHLLGTPQEHRPIQLQNNDAIKRSVKMLDLIYPYETYKIGVLYVGVGQSQDETGILSNCYGSTRYMEFLQGLGHLVQLTDTNPQDTFIGGLDINGNDGKFAYAWHDDFMQTIYHVATLMPQKESDPKCNQKKLHIGNDYVTIVYNESGEEYKIGTIKGQFNYVNIVITPLDHASNAVTVQTKDDISEIIGHTDTKIISDAYLSALVRQMAVHANLASEILKRQQTNPGDPYASNWLERLRQIKRIRVKVENETQSSPGSHISTPILEDFTDFV